MPKFETTRHVPFSPQQMFDVVADVEKYPQFLPLCEDLHVKSRTRHGTTTVLIATMTIGYKAIRESFTTRVTIIPDEWRVLVEYLDGPFHHLENRWRFLPASRGTDIHFYIEYEFRSAMLGLLMGALFDKAFRKFAQAFEERARALYRPATEPSQPVG